MNMIISTRQGHGLCQIELNNPPLNLVTVALLEELDAALDAAIADDSVHVVVLSGHGPRAFCAGSDLKQTLSLKQAGRFVEAKLAFESQVLKKLAAAPKPVLAAVEGVAFGGGLELAACCDLVFASEESRFALPEINIAGFPPTGVLRLAHSIGSTRLKQLVLLGTPISARTALEWGLCNELFEPGDVAHHVLQIAEVLAARPRRAMQLAKRAMRLVTARDEDRILAEILELSDQLARSRDGVAGAEAFLNKAPASFSDPIFR